MTIHPFLYPLMLDGDAEIAASHFSAVTGGTNFAADGASFVTPLAIIRSMAGAAKAVPTAP